MSAARKRTIAEVRLRRAITPGVKAKPKRRKLPTIHHPNGIARDYARALLAIVVRMRRAFAPLLAALPGLSASALAERERHDAGETDEARRLLEQAKSEIAAATVTRDIETLADKFARETSTYQRKQFNKQTKAALGVEVFSPDKRHESLIRAFVNANVGLIKGIGNTLATQIESATMQALTTGTLHKNLAKELQGKFGFAEKRAKLIARDQIGKIYGQITAMRQRETGVDAFIWRTMEDERVRPEHRARNGNRYLYSDPPNGELPGEPILCRCYAEPDFNSLLAGLDDEP